MGFWSTVLAILLALAVRDWVMRPVPVPVDKNKNSLRGRYRGPG
jgi:hypothetical protein